MKTTSVAIALLSLLLPFTSVVYSGNENQPSNAGDIRGQILLKISHRDLGDGRVVSPDVDDMYLVIPQQGTITKFNGSAKPESIETGSGTRVLHGCYNKPTSVSPDHKFVAECQGAVAPTMIGSKPDHFILRRAGSTAILYESDLRQAIIGSLWSRDSQAIAVLSETVHVSWDPRYWFYLFSGHPIQFETYDLHVINAVNLNVTSFKVPLKAFASMARILSFTD